MPDTPTAEQVYNLSLQTVCLERLNQWNLTVRQRLVAYWIVRLSYGRGRGHVWLTGLLIARITGLYEPDVSNTIGQLREKRVLECEGASNRPRRFKFLPDAEIVGPARLVEKSIKEAALEEAERMNAGLEGEEAPLPDRGIAAEGDRGSQHLLPVLVDEERYARRIAEGSERRALEEDPSARERTLEARKGLERLLRSSLGWTETEVDVTAPVPVARLFAAAKGLLPEDCGGELERIEALIGSDQISESLISGTGTNPTALGTNPRVAGAPALARVDSQLTVDRTDKSVQLTVSRAPVSESLSRPRRADPDLMRELSEIIGPLWYRKNEKGEGNFGALWNRALRSSEFAPCAAREAINVYHTKRLTETFDEPGRYVWGTFKKLHSKYRHT